jgi:hypothetical protein
MCLIFLNFGTPRYWTLVQYSLKTLASLFRLDVTLVLMKVSGLSVKSSTLDAKESCISYLDSKQFALPYDQQECRTRFIYPVTDAVTAAVLICPPPEFFGTLRRIEPLFRLMVRVPPLKLKIVCEPRRVIVIS